MERDLTAEEELRLKDTIYDALDDPNPVPYTAEYNLWNWWGGVFYVSILLVILRAGGLA